MEGSTSCSVPTIGAPPAKAVTRKNPAKRDRHSKICTAQGTRDRRMRLSLGIARKFFDLQDLLGFDKASKTVEWLLLKSRPAIEQLTAAAQSDAVASAAHAESAVNLAAGDSPESRPDTDPKAKALPRKTAVYVLGKESRGRARERAKERACRRRRVGAGEESGGILSLSSWSPNSSSEVVQPSATATLGEQQQDAGNGFPHEVQNPRVKFLDLPEYWVEAPTTVSNNCTENPLPSPARLMMNYYYDYNCLQTQPEDRFRFYGKVWEGYSPI